MTDHPAVAETPLTVAYRDVDAMLRAYGVTATSAARAGMAGSLLALGYVKLPADPDVAAFLASMKGDQ